jgi:hypothetical protein
VKQNSIVKEISNLGSNPNRTTSKVISVAASSLYPASIIDNYAASIMGRDSTFDIQEWGDNPIPYPLPVDQARE